MDAPITPAMIALLSSPTAAPALTSAWLKDLHMQNRRFGALKGVGFTPGDLTTLNLPIVLPTHAAAQIQHMLVKIGAILRQATDTDTSITHSDLLAALEAGTAEKYAEIRIRAWDYAKLSPYEVFEELRGRVVHSRNSIAVGKTNLTMPVDTMTAEVLNTFDFSTVGETPDLQEPFTVLFDNFSYLPSLHLRNISEVQLRLLFAQLLEVNKEAYLRQKSLRPQKSSGAPPHSPAYGNSNVAIRPAVRTSVKTVVLCGLSQQAAKALHVSPTVQAIQHELGIKVAFDLTLGRK
jgi:hypothetical protein